MRELQVYLNIENKEHVGTLAESGGKTYFEYNQQFVEKGIQLSPYILPLQKDIIEFKHPSFGDCFGVFKDSLPDGWGLLLIDRYLKGQGVNTRRFSSFDYLSFIGDRALGALSYEPTAETISEFSEVVALSKLEAESKEVYSGQSNEVLEQLMIMGGSPGGARPKVLVKEMNDGSISSEVNNPRTGDKLWIVKFDVDEDFKDFARVEYLYSKLARLSGIRMPETKIFEGENGKFYYGIERFDRNGTERVHTHSLGGLIHSNFRIPSCDYETLLKVTHSLTQNVCELHHAFRQMVFNIIFHNRDDHVKNFSFLLGKTLEWQLSPGYDITPSYGPRGEHSMTINGKGDNITEDDIFSVAKKCGVKKSIADEILQQVLASVESIDDLASQIDLNSKDLKLVKQSYISLIR